MVQAPIEKFGNNILNALSSLYQVLSGPNKAFQQRLTNDSRDCSWTALGIVLVNELYLVLKNGHSVGE